MKTTKAIYQVKVYNNLRRYDFEQAVKNWTPEQGGFPHLNMYIFNRKNGWVAVNGGSHRLFKNSDIAQNYLDNN